MTDRRSRLAGAALGALGGTIAGGVLPAVAAAHQLTERYASPLPLAAYVLGAATAVALSFGFVVVRSGRSTPRPEPDATRSILVPGPVRAGLRALGLVGWLWVVVQGVTGAFGDAADAPSLILWVYGWVGLSLVSALVGPAWHWIDPFSTIYDLLAGLGGRLRLHGPATIPYPAVLRSWPAVAGYATFVWLELVIEGARAGRLLSALLVLYTLWTLAMMAQYGRDTWRAHGETFSVWFGTLGRLAPLALDGGSGTDGRLRVRRFGAALAAGPWTADLVVLVAIATGGILYDGLSQTVVFLDLFGVPAVIGATALLLGWLALVAGLALVVARVVGLPALGAGLLPIAVGYLIAHYLTYLLFDGQRIVALVNDPLNRGAMFLGIDEFQPAQSWLPAAMAWGIQLGSVVGGHVVGAWAGHRAAVDAATRAGTSTAPETTRAIRLRQLPLAALMVGLTSLTLWSLGQVIVEHG
jgi:hypothetical protein